MPFIYRINQLTFVGGRTLNCGKLTVFIGPNNSGKSRLLKDILSLSCDERPRTILLASIATTLPVTVREAATDYGIHAETNINGQTVTRYVRPTFDGQEERSFGRGQWPDGLVPGGPDPRQFATWFGSALTAFLTTAKRLALVEQGSLDGANRATLFQQLFNSDRAIEATIRERVKGAFPECEIAMDIAASPRVEFRVKEDFSGLPLEVRDARPILQAADRLDDQGDGLRSYAGIVTAMTAAKRPITLIDEPEAFLHPPQAFRIGEFIADQANDENQLIVATHSVDVLRGIISRTNDVKVVRLDRRGNATNWAELENAEVQQLYSDPLLSSAGVLNGLFFSGVIVTEADADSRFYGSVSRQMDPGRDIHLINADNKQTVPRVLNMYKKMGVRAAGILDIDVLNDQDEFTQQLDAIGVVGNEREAARQARTRIETELKAPNLIGILNALVAETQQISRQAAGAFTQTEAMQEQAIRSSRSALGDLREKSSIWHHLKKNGRATLVKTSADFDFIANLFRARGVFINPYGELEASLGAVLPWRKNKKTWLREAVALLPSLQVEVANQPWKLIADVHTYLDQ